MKWKKYSVPLFCFWVNVFMGTSPGCILLKSHTKDMRRASKFHAKDHNRLSYYNEMKVVNIALPLVVDTINLFPGRVGKNLVSLLTENVNT